MNDSPEWVLRQHVLLELRRRALGEKTGDGARLQYRRPSSNHFPSKTSLRICDGNEADGNEAHTDAATAVRLTGDSYER